MRYFKIICKASCPFCINAKNLLIKNELPFEYCSIDYSPELFEHYKTIYSHTTVPMVIVKEEGVDDKFIGGYTELVKYFEEGGS
jgi:glutaredoxin